MIIEDDGSNAEKPIVVLPWDLPEVPESAKVRGKWNFIFMSFFETAVFDSPNPLESQEHVKGLIMQLSSNKRTVLEKPPKDSEFVKNFKLSHYVPQAMEMLKLDERLSRWRWDLVPGKVREEGFWCNYFYRVDLVIKAYSVDEESILPSMLDDENGGLMPNATLEQQEEEDDDDDDDEDEEPLAAQVSSESKQENSSIEPPPPPQEGTGSTSMGTAEAETANGQQVETETQDSEESEVIDEGDFISDGFVAVDLLHGGQPANLQIEDALQQLKLTK